MDFVKDNVMRPFISDPSLTHNTASFLGFLALHKLYDAHHSFGDKKWFLVKMLSHLSIGVLKTALEQKTNSLKVKSVHPGR